MMKQLIALVRILRPLIAKYQAAAKDGLTTAEQVTLVRDGLKALVAADITLVDILELIDETESLLPLIQGK